MHLQFSQVHQIKTKMKWNKQQNDWKRADIFFPSSLLSQTYDFWFLKYIYKITHFKVDFLIDFCKMANSILIWPEWHDCHIWNKCLSNLIAAFFVCQIHSIYTISVSANMGIPFHIVISKRITICVTNLCMGYRIRVVQYTTQSHKWLHSLHNLAPFVWCL